MGKRVFHLHEGVEICGKDESKSFDNLTVADPVFDESGALIIEVPVSTEPAHADKKVTLRIHANNIAYEVLGDEDAMAVIISDIEAREDCLKL